MKKTKKLNFLKFSENISNWILATIIAIYIFSASLIVDYATLPKGFELPKATFLANVGFVILIVFLSMKIFKVGIYIYEKRELSFLKNNKIWFEFILLGIFSFLLLFSAVSSPFSDIAIYGNEWRLQGVLTYLPIFLVGYVVYKTINRNSSILISLAIILSGLLHAMKALEQFKGYYISDLDKIAEGLWVNGYYGQANFFSTHTVIAVILVFAVLKSDYVVKISNKVLKSLVYIIFLLIGLILNIGTIFSFSIWGWITLILVAITIFTYQLISKKRNFAVIYIIGTILSLIIWICVINLYPEYNLRIHIIESSKNIFITNFTLGFEGIKNNLIGHGFDTIGEVFRSFSQFPTVYIDRGHNIFVDLIMQGGLFLFTTFIFLVLKIYQKIFKIVQDPYIFIFFFATTIWIFKTIINEYSIVNIAQFVILFGIILSLVPTHKSEVK